MDDEAKYSDDCFLAIDNSISYGQSDHPSGAVEISNSCQETVIVRILIRTGNLVVLDCSVHCNCVVTYDHQEYQDKAMLNKEIKNGEPGTEKV